MNMFGKGSRYRRVLESSPVNARGERQRGKELRVIPRAEGRFVHTVREGERLDLLAFKYYGDPTRWWQISDANPEEPYPPDLLDRHPLVAERFVLEYATFDARRALLLEALAPLGQTAPAEGPTEGGAVAPGFLESTAVVVYAESAMTRRKILNEIRSHGFNLLAARSQTRLGVTTEAFTFDDLAAKTAWRALVEELAGAAGVLSVRSRVVESALDISYNAEAVERAQLLALVEGLGFATTGAPSRLTRTGAKIVIPPNRTV